MNGSVGINPRRGEIQAFLDGESHRLCLTLGALAELEHALGESDMLAVAERFATGRVKASDAIRLIGAGLRAGGLDIADERVARMRVDGGAVGFVDIVARLLAATFAPADAAAGAAVPGDAPRRKAARDGAAPGKS